MPEHHSQISSVDHLIGFDAREMFINHQDEWPLCRIEAALIKTDIIKPLSVDTDVWQSIFDLEWDSKNTRSIIDKILPKGIGPLVNIWASLKELQSYCQRIDDIIPKPFWIIGITVVHNAALDEYLRSRNSLQSLLHLDETLPRSVAKDWHFLGYDVADAGRLSGLANCLFLDETDAQESRAFSPYINDYHLFNSLDNACRFRDYSDKRVKEHAPFFIYGLYRITVWK